MRREADGAIHHVTAHAVTGQPLFGDDEDREAYLDVFGREALVRGWRVMTFVLMTNHVHHLIETPKANLGRGFELAHGDYARAFNRRHGGRGHVFHRRFHNTLVESERHLFGCFRYIARNPVAAGICGRPEDHGWSAHAALAGLEAPPDWLDLERALDLLGGRAAYLAGTNRDDVELLTELERTNPSGWLIAAVDDFRIPVEAIRAYLGISRSAVYRRIRAQRQITSVSSSRTTVTTAERRRDGPQPIRLEKKTNTVGAYPG